jgi:hypothetical protein
LLKRKQEIIRNRDNKRHKFLLVWDKDSYTEIPVFASRQLCIATTLFRFCQTSSLLPGPLSIVASANLRLLYLLLYSEHINHIQVLGFLPLPYSSRVWSRLSVWPMSNNTTSFVLGL